jgi:hypothetical protein
MYSVEECSFATLLQSTQHGKDVAESCIKKKGYVLHQQCHVKDLYTIVEKF